jgi:hypothetical protein
VLKAPVVPVCFKMPTPVTVLGDVLMSGEQQARREDQTGKVPERFEAEINQREVGGN